MDETTVSKQDFFVIAIGCSAGGTTAYNELFSRLPIDMNAAFIIIQHLHPDFVSTNHQLLTEYTSMKTFSAKEGQKVVPGCVYFLPENAMMAILNRTLQIRPRRKDEIINRAVDIFFTSLADDLKEKGIGVILSGYGKDGSEGAIQMHKCGGTVIVQSPRSALYKGMPQSSIEYDNPDYILDPDELAARLMELTGYPSERKLL